MKPNIKTLVSPALKLSRHISKKWAVAIAVIITRTLIGLSMGKPILLPDSPMYTRIPGRGVFEQVSFMGELPRPWVVTLPFAITGTTNWLVFFNVFFGTLAWLALIFSVAKLNFSKPLLRTLAITLVVFLSCSEAAMAWDRFAQADSIALSGCILVAAAVVNVIALKRVRLIDLSLLAIGTVFGGLIRPGIGFLVIAFLILSICIDFAQSRRLIRTVGIATLILLPLFYMGALNQKMDSAWGKAFKGNEQLNGRTLQQVAIINSTPVGSVFTREVVGDIAGTTSCEFKYLSEPIVGGDAMAWWLHMYEQCPNTDKVSRGFNSKFAIALLKHPKTTWDYLHVPLAEASQVGKLDNQVINLIPPIFQDSVFGAPGRGFIGPVSYWIAFLALAIVSARRQKRVTLQSFLILLSSVLLFMGLIFTVAFSPLDTSRVAQPFFMLSTTLALISIIKVTDDLLRGTKIFSSVQP
jgi:hypothetical protein